MEVPALKGASLTLVDVLGTLVPGLVWLFLILLTIHRVVLGDFNLEQEIERTKEVAAAGPIFQSAAVVTVLAVGLTVGYIVKAFAMEAAGAVERFLRGVFIFVISCFSRTLRTNLGLEYLSLWSRFKRVMIGLKFPYPLLHDNTEYYLKLRSIVRQHSGLDNESQMTTVFSYSKRLIRISSSELWEESQQLEAEVRMMGSLFLASFLGLILVIVAGRDGSVDPMVHTKLAGIAGTVLLSSGWAFSRRRREEVRYTYLNAILLNGARIGGQRPQARFE